MKIGLPAHGAARPPVMMVKTMPEWLGFAIEERFAHFNRYMNPILRKYEDEVRCRIFDTEFFSTRVTDVWV